MALSLLPSNFQSISSISPSHLYVLKFHTQTHSLKSFRAPILKVCCTQQTVHLVDEIQGKDIVVKKRRKPRPSFLQQIQDKWSLKTPLLIENFPWEKQDGEDTNGEARTQMARSRVKTRPILGDESFEKESKNLCSSSEVVTTRTSIKPTVAPWEHGNDHRNKVISSKGPIELHKNVLDNGQEVNDYHEHRANEEALVSNARHMEDFEKEEILDGKTKVEKCGNSEDVTVVFRNYQVACSGNRYTDENNSVRLPWESKNDEELVKTKPKIRKTELAERSIPEPELKRLRNVSLRMVEIIKVGAAGVTQALVAAIHEKWKSDEVVKLKFKEPISKNMKRLHETLERGTGGLVIYRSGSLVVLYRGMTYKFECVKSYGTNVQTDAEALESSPEVSPQSTKDKCPNAVTESSGVYGSKQYKNISEEAQMNWTEINNLLDELGPRFTDWSGGGPIPVDADLLPALVPGYKTPFRLLPYGIRQALRDSQMTYLRRTARTMPPHFALGRCRELQGLAVAMVKLWEKSAIAKIAIKRGVVNTNNERMAQELKILTGGTLVSRNKEFIVFYRGNDFLPPDVSSKLTEVEKSAILKQDEEDRARDRASTMIRQQAKMSAQPLVAGTLAETVAATSRWGIQPSAEEDEKMMRDTAVARHASLVKSYQRKLTIAKGKMRSAEKALGKVLENQEPEDLPNDLETLTDEERFLFRRIGFSMKPFLLLGRREIFDGIIENMHLHWKYRELVKIIIKRKTFPQVRHIALSLEAESGGLLVSVDRTPKGHVIIIYRGKNYQRPISFRPRNLLTKRQALVRSIELQRREALKHHILELDEKLEKLKQELEDMMSVHDDGTETSDSIISGATDDSNDQDVEVIREEFDSSTIEGTIC